MVHRRPVYINLLNVPSFSSRYFNKIKRTSRLGRLLALSLEILSNTSFNLIIKAPVEGPTCQVNARPLFWPVADPEGVQVILGQMMFKGLFHL